MKQKAKLVICLPIGEICLGVEIHQAVAATPLGVLGQLEPIAGVVGTAQDLTARSIGAVYDTIRRVNEQVGVFAEQILMTQGEMADKADPEGQ